MAVALRTIQANGIRIAYYEEGMGPLVLLLHGFPDTAHTWDVTRPALAQAGFRAVSPFSRGYHPTEIPEGGASDSDVLARDALALIEALGEKDAILVGHDWGASAAYSAVGLAPERIRFLVTLAIPHPAGMLPTPKVLYAARHFLYLNLPGAAARIRAGGMSYLDELVQRWSPARRIEEEDTRDVKESLSHPGSLEAAVAYYRSLRRGVPRSQRRKVEVPAAVFAGTDDVLPLHYYERARSRYLRGCEIVSMPGGHFLHRDHPARFNEELLRLLTPLPR